MLSYPVALTLLVLLFDCLVGASAVQVHGLPHPGSGSQAARKLGRRETILRLCRTAGVDASGRKPKQRLSVEAAVPGQDVDVRRRHG